MERQIKISECNLDALEAEIPEAPETPKLPSAALHDTELQRIKKALAALNVDRARKSLALAQEAATRTEETRKQLELEQKTLSALTAAVDELTERLDPEIELEHAEAQAKLEDVRNEYGEAQKAAAALEAEIKALDVRIFELEGQARDLEQRKARIASAQADLAEWRYLQIACGPDGIQALELDAMGPGISEVANRLLSAAYGSRFSIELRTTRIAGKGSKTKQVEDFAIIVIDNELFTEQPIETLSGGESVWIKQSLYSAFAIVRDRTTSIRFLTAYKDECDGALDPESRAKYFQLLEAEHVESGRRHTLIITHSESAQEMISQRIVMQRPQ